jgi:peptidoglycan/LPS O-acetylase OafA/YrhL
MSTRAARFPLFDSLRAIAALAVLGTHAAVFAGLETSASSSTLRPYTARLEVGVAVFFVISGFLLYRPFVAARARGEARPAAGPYAWRRFLRIVPAYWVALTLITLWVGTPGVFSLSGVPRFYGFGQAYSESTLGGGITQAWSLTVEVAFYAFLPLWAAFVAWLSGSNSRGRLRAELVGVAVLFSAAIAWKLVVLSGTDPHKVEISPQLIALPAYLDQFALGMGLAVLSVWLGQRDGLPRLLKPIERFPSLCWLVAGAAFWAASTQIGLRGRFFEPFSRANYMERHLLYALFAVALVTPAVVGDQTRGVVRRLLATRPLLWLGLVSYGIFLWNLTIVDHLGRWGLGDVPVLRSYPGWVVAGTAATAAVAAASYYLVERPALSLKRFLSDPGRPVRGDALEEPAPVTALAPPAG